MDYAAFKNGVCIAIASVMEGRGADKWKRDFYTENAGLEIKILPRGEAVKALQANAIEPAKWS